MDNTAKKLDFLINAWKWGNMVMQAASIARRPPVPVYFLYGEPRRDSEARFLHVEPLADRTVPSNWNITPHVHADLHHMFLISQGGGRLMADVQEIRFDAPCLLVVPASAVHGIVYRPGTAGQVLTLADSYLREITRLEPAISGIFAGPSCLDIGKLRLFEDQVERLGQELGSDAPGATTAAEGHLLGILVAVLRLACATGHAAPQLAGRATELVTKFRDCVETMHHTGAELQDYADALRVTRAQLRRACLQVTGQPPMALIHGRIFLEAQRILLHTNRDVTEVAYDLGFSDSAYFSRFFSRRARCSPRAFRRQLLPRV